MSTTPTRPLPGSPLRLRLYVAGLSPNAMIARAKLESIIAAHKRRLIDVEIIDVIEQPELAVRDNVVVTPMLLRLTPTPRIKMIGNLNDRPSVMRALGLDRHDDKVE